MKLDIVRAWKDEVYRQSLSDEQLSLVPDHPAGELSDADLASVYGGSGGGSDEWNGLSLTDLAAFATLALRKKVHWHSLNATCEDNIFSTRQTVPRAQLVLSPILVICTNHS